LDFKVEGRHDPCICPRVVPVAEAMVALVLLDHILLQERVATTTAQEQVRQKLATIDAEMQLLAMQKKLYEDELAELQK
jgi:hypothetical protein